MCVCGLYLHRTTQHKRNAGSNPRFQCSDGQNPNASQTGVSHFKTLAFLTRYSKLTAEVGYLCNLSNILILLNNRLTSSPQTRNLLITSCEIKRLSWKVALKNGIGKMSDIGVRERERGRKIQFYGGQGQMGGRATDPLCLCLYPLA